MEQGKFGVVPWCLVAACVVSAATRSALAQDTSTMAGVTIEEIEAGPNAGWQPRPASERPVEPADETAASRFHATFGVDYTNKYFGRGIVTQTKGLIVQPYADLSLDFYRAEEFTLSAEFGTWDSIHDRRGSAATTDHTVSHWFESDLYTGVGASFDDWSLDARYFWYASPSGSFGTIEEVYFSAAFDDSKYLEEWAMNPSAVLTFETTLDQADGGSRKGSYFQLGVAPSVTFDVDKVKDVEVSFPVTVGMSLSNFYEGPGGQNDFFGYASIGASAGVPLALDKSWGEWKLKGGVQALFLGSATSAMNNDRHTEVIFNLGVEASF